MVFDEVDRKNRSAENRGGAVSCGSYCASLLIMTLALEGFH
jgi:predicted outer membrane repeat protein